MWWQISSTMHLTIVKKSVFVFSFIKNALNNEVKTKIYREHEKR